MSLSIVNNSASLNAQQSLNNTNNALNTSLERRSPGLKINTGADGPAAYVISQEQQAQIAGLNTAIDNTNQAVTVVQTAEGALNEVNSLLTQIRGLALNSANSGVNRRRHQLGGQPGPDQQRPRDHQQHLPGRPRSTA